MEVRQVVGPGRGERLRRRGRCDVQSGGLVRTDPTPRQIDQLGGDHCVLEVVACVVDRDDPPLGIGLHMQRLAGRTGAVVRAVDVEVVVVRLPDRAVPRRVGHPQHQPAGVVPQVRVPRLEHGPRVLVVDELRLAREVVQAGGRPETCFYGRLVRLRCLVSVLAPVVVVPRALDRPLGLVAGHVAHAGGGGDDGHADLRVEPEVLAAVGGRVEVLLRLDPAVGSAAGDDAAGGVVLVEDAGGLVLHGLAHALVDGGGWVALVGAAPDHHAGVDAVAQDGVPGDRVEGVVVRRVHAPRVGEVVPHQDAVLVAGGEELLPVGRAHPVADHREVHVAVHAYGRVHPLRRHPAQEFVPAPVATAGQHPHAVDADLQRIGRVGHRLDVRPRVAVVRHLDHIRLRVGRLPQDGDPVETLRGPEVDLDPLVVRVLRGPTGARVTVGGVRGRVVGVLGGRGRLLVQGQVGRRGRAVDDTQRPQGVAPTGVAQPAGDTHIACRPGGEVLHLQARVGVAERQRHRAVVHRRGIGPGGVVGGDLHQVGLGVCLFPHQVHLVEGLHGPQVDPDPLVVRVGRGPAGVGITVGHVGGAVVVAVRGRRVGRCVQGQIGAGPRAVAYGEGPHGVAPTGRPGKALDAHVPCLLPVEGHRLGVRVTGVDERQRHLVRVAELADAEPGRAPVALGAVEGRDQGEFMERGVTEAVGPPQLGVLQTQLTEGVGAEGDVDALARGHGDGLAHPDVVEGRGDRHLVGAGVGVADRDDDRQFGDQHLGQVRQRGVDARVADHDMAGRSQPDVVPDAGGPVAYRRHPVPARRGQVGGGVEVHLVGARVHPGLTGGALVAGAAGHRHGRDLHGERVRPVRCEGRGHVVGRAGEGVGQTAHVVAVEPDVGGVVDAVELQPDPAPRPGAQTVRKLEVPLVPPGVA